MSVLSDEQRRERIAAIEAHIRAAEAAGRAWSGRSLYQALGGSHTTLTAYLKQRRATSPATVAPAAEAPRRAAGELPVSHDPVSAPPPPEGFSTALPDPVYDAPADPVVAAERALRLAELHLADARDALLHAKGVLAATLPLRVDGLLHGPE